MFQNPAARLTPMTPNTVISTFNYRRAIQADDTEAAAELVATEPRMPALLANVAERIVVAVTAHCGLDPETCDDSFALEVVGHILVTTLHNAGVLTREAIRCTAVGSGRAGRPRPRRWFSGRAPSPRQRLASAPDSGHAGWSGRTAPHGTPGCRGVRTSRVQ